MDTNMRMPIEPGAAMPPLGAFLRERRARIRPTADAAATGARRTPGLRREEVATRAGVSVGWYTWLEQGRGGPPSEAALERIARALELDAAARELLFILAQHRPPPLSAAPVLSAVAPEVQRVLDALALSPALVKTPWWDVVAWNRAATAVLSDPGGHAVSDRNLLRRIFTDEAARARMPDWEAVAQFVIGVFRSDVARAGGSPEAAALLAELNERSPAFRRLWAVGEVRHHGVGRKRILHPVAGELALDMVAFVVSGAPDLSMIVFTPATAADERAVAALLGT